jgi:GTPase Era involved in 16S rRNA processing
VGKSSLLNRFAGARIAATGATRPTSTQATMYVHRSQALNPFSADSPMADTRVEYHGVEKRRDVAWLDMPDIDSVKSHNRKIVLAWLPYIDWLIYVVSPERYRDDTGWQLLQHRHHKHHWLFVINRWDEAANVQLNEFVSDLQAAGYNNPVVLRTSCVQQDDDFEQLEGIIGRAIQDHSLAELQRIGVLSRLADLDAMCSSMMHKIGSETIGSNCR